MEVPSCSVCSATLILVLMQMLPPQIRHFSLRGYGGINLGIVAERRFDLPPIPTHALPPHSINALTFVLSTQTDLAAIPLVAWAVSEPGLLDPAAACALASSLPYAAETLDETMVSTDDRLTSVIWAIFIRGDIIGVMLAIRGVISHQG